MRERSQSTAAFIRGSARGDGGFVVPITLFIVLAALAVVMVAVVASIQAQSGTTRDLRSKGALQTAESGVDQALLRYNTYSSTSAPLTSALPCITASGGRTFAAGGWCGGVTTTDGGGTATYYVKPIYANGSASSIEIVSVGSSSGVSRRVDVTATSAAGQSAFSSASVLAQNGIIMASNSWIHAGSATNGDIALSSNAQLCGGASVGIGRVLSLQGNAAYFSDTACTSQVSPSSVGHAPLNLSPASQGDAAVSNDDGRLTNAVQGSGSPADLISGKRSDVTWSPTTRTLSVNHNSNLTLTGTKYSFCQVTLLQNSALYIAAGQNVAIFFDSPEACNQASGTTQLQLSSNSRITGANGAPVSLAMVFVGSPLLATSMQMNSNTQAPASCVQNFVIYAPYTDIQLSSNSDYCGAMAGKTIALASNSHILTDNASQSYVLPAASAHYGVTKFVECSAAAASPPNTGC